MAQGILGHTMGDPSTPGRNRTRHPKSPPSDWARYLHRIKVFSGFRVNAHEWDFFPVLGGDS